MSEFLDVDFINPAEVESLNQPMSIGKARKGAVSISKQAYNRNVI